jgi:tRNA dimethylallyltransferase
MASPNRSPRIAVVGCTASGKTALAELLCAQLAAEGRVAEMISADSMCVYRGMDIGTAKPSASDRQRYPTHAIDLVNPDEEFSVSEFQRVANAAIADIESRSAIPILVGGTGLYVDAVVNELTMPGQFPQTRTELEAELTAGVRIEELYARLQKLDPVAAGRMEPNNDRRIVRALEVTIGSGQPFSSFGPGLRESQSTETKWLQLGVQWSREALAKRIEERFAAQMANGFLAEASDIREQYGDRLSKTAKQALGYKELWTHLEGSTALDEAVEIAKLRTRQFAVRQERWFRRNPHITWLNGEAPFQVHIPG